MTNGLGYEPIPHAPLIPSEGGNLIADEIRAHLGYMDLRSAIMDLGFNSYQDLLVKRMNSISRYLVTPVPQSEIKIDLKNKEPQELIIPLFKN